MLTKKQYLCTHNDRGVEQLVARWAHNPKVVCSSQASATKKREKYNASLFFCFTPAEFRIIRKPQTPFPLILTLLIDFPRVVLLWNKSIYSWYQRVRTPGYQKYVVNTPLK